MSLILVFLQVTLAKFFNPCYTTAQLKPTLFSKVRHPNPPTCALQWTLYPWSSGVAVKIYLSLMHECHEHPNHNYSCTFKYSYFLLVIINITENVTRLHVFTHVLLILKAISSSTFMHITGYTGYRHFICPFPACNTLAVMSVDTTRWRQTPFTLLEDGRSLSYRTFFMPTFY